MPREDNKIIKYKHGEKSMKILFTFYADLESLHKKDICHNNPKKSTTKINKHIPSVYLLFTHCSVDITKKQV